MENMSILLH